MAPAKGPGSTSAPDKLTIDLVKPLGPRNIEKVLWPGLVREVGVMQLHCDELLDAHVAARDHFRKLGVPADMWSASELENEEVVQQVALMLVDPDDRTGESKIFKDAKDARQRLSHVERAFWCAQHELHFGERAHGLSLAKLLQGDEDDA